MKQEKFVKTIVEAGEAEQRFLMLANYAVMAKNAGDIKKSKRLWKQARALVTTENAKDLMRFLLELSEASENDDCNAEA